MLKSPGRRQQKLGKFNHSLTAFAFEISILILILPLDKISFRVDHMCLYRQKLINIVCIVFGYQEWIQNAPVFQKMDQLFTSVRLCLFRKDRRCLFFYVELQLFEIVHWSYTFLFFFFFFKKFEDLRKKEATKSGFCTGFGNYWLPDAWHMKYL